MIHSGVWALDLVVAEAGACILPSTIRCSKGKDKAATIHQLHQGVDPILSGLEVRQEEVVEAASEVEVWEADRRIPLVGSAVVI